MNDPIILDSAPLGRLAHHRARDDITRWHDAMLHAGRTLIVPELADYEVRRNLLLHDFRPSIRGARPLEEIVGISTDHHGCDAPRR